MTPLQLLQRDAAQKRIEMDAAYDDLRARLTVRGLVDEAVACVAPYRPHVVPIYESVKRYPLIAAVLLVGAGYLTSLGRDGRPAKKTANRKLKSRNRQRRLQ